MFEELLGLSFARARDIMNLKPGDENFSDKVMARQTSIISSMMSTTARVDEARLRGRGKDRVQEILAAIKAEERKIQ